MSQAVANNRREALDVQRSAAEDVLKRLQTHPEAWMRVDAILEASKTQQTKFFALQVGATLAAVVRHAD